MTTEPSAVTETIECPLCLGEGRLKRTEVLDRLGVKDLARVAQLSAEEAFRLLQKKHNHDNENGWARFETELSRRTADIAERHKDELHALTARTKELEAAARTAEQQNALEIQHANRRVEDSLREAAALRERNQVLEAEMSKVARVDTLLVVVPLMYLLRFAVRFSALHKSLLFNRSPASVPSATSMPS